MRQVDAAAARRGPRSRDIGTHRDRRRRTSRCCRRINGAISMVFQFYALFPHLTVEREHHLRAAHPQASMPKVARRAPARRSRRCSASRRSSQRRPSQLSGGQQQRVAMGRAIIAEAPVCLMDEPMSNLDAKLRNEMRTEIQALQRQLGITMLYVTHDQIEAMSMADQVVLLCGGARRAGRAARDDVLAAGRPLRRTVHRPARDEPAAARADAAWRGDRRLATARPSSARPRRAWWRASAPKTSCRARATAFAVDASSARNTSAPTRCCAVASAASIFWCAPGRRRRRAGRRRVALVVAGRRTASIRRGKRASRGARRRHAPSPRRNHDARNDRSQPRR